MFKGFASSNDCDTETFRIRLRYNVKVQTEHLLFLPIKHQFPSVHKVRPARLIWRQKGRLRIQTQRCRHPLRNFRSRSLHLIRSDRQSLLELLRWWKDFRVQSKRYGKWVFWRHWGKPLWRRLIKEKKCIPSHLLKSQVPRATQRGARGNPCPV